MKHFLPSLFLLLILLIPCPGFGQFAENIQTFGGSYSDYVQKIVHDKNDNRYILGSIGQPGSVTIPGYQPEKIDFGSFKKEVTRSFIAKFYKENKCIWVKAAPLSIDNNFHDLAIDEAGFIYLTSHTTVYSFVLEKLDQDGNTVWEKTFRPEIIFSDNNFRSFWGDKLAVDKQGNIYISGRFDGTGFSGLSFDFDWTKEKQSTEFLAKFNSEGEVLWVKTSLEASIGYSHLIIDSSGNIITSGGLSKKINIAGYELENTNPLNSYGQIVESRFFVKRDPDGNVLWARNFPVKANYFSPSVVLDADDNIYFTTYFESEDPEVTIDSVRLDRSAWAGIQFNGGNLIKLDPNGRAKWAISFLNNSYAPMIYANQSLYLTGIFSKEFNFQDKVLRPNKEWSPDIFIAKLNLDGKVEWMKRYGGLSYEGSPQISFVPKRKEIVLAASFAEKLPNNGKYLTSIGLGDIFIGQIPDTLADGIALNAKISGRMYTDTNSNCFPDASEKGLAQKLLKIDPGNMYTITDEHGNYSARVPYGQFTVTPLISPTTKSQTIENCREYAQATTDSLHQQVTDINFGYTIKECTLLTVDVATDRLRRCFRSQTTVTYTNDGTADAQNVKIKVTYPEYVVPISSSLPWVARQESNLLFEVGTLKAGERRSFVITDSTICGNEAIRGLSQCIKAAISPRNVCVAPNPAWDESSVTVAASYAPEEQNAQFTIANEGSGHMTDSTEYRLYANQALIKTGKVMLAQGEQAKLAVPATPATLRLEADQSQHHPGQSRPTVSLQMALPPDVPNAPPAMAAPTPVDNFYQDDADAEVEIACQTIVDSYDPNDKQVSPSGITKRHYIKAKDELEYFIRFQNTGTDVAYNVVIQDTLSPYLDISTLRVGSGSHPFTYSVSGKGQPVLTFTFKNINLPDHKTNEPASHGYIKFNISQTPDNAKGTIIKNIAYNYFDYNSPVATNQVFNIIGDTIMLPPAPIMVYDCGPETPTTAQTGPDQEVCGKDKITLQANTPQKGAGRWQLISGQATIVAPTNSQTDLILHNYEPVELEWTITLCNKVSRSKIKVNRYPIPPAPVIPVPPVQCEGSKLVPLLASGKNIIWYADAGKTKIVHTGHTFTPAINTTTTFYVTQTLNNCESPVTAVTVSIQPARISLTVSGDTLIAPPAEAYQWYFNDQEITGATKRKFLARNTGNYQVKIITNGCEVTSEQVHQVISLAAPELTISPNPTAQQLHYEFTSNEMGPVQFIIWDELGRKVFTSTHYKPTTILPGTLTLTGLQPGLYLLEIRTEQTRIIRKFIKL